jgi:hypothetical protein
MRSALTKLLPEDRQSFAKRSCKSSNNNERQRYQSVRVSSSLAAFCFDLLFAACSAAHYRSAWGVLSFITSFYGIGRAKFSDKVRAE